MRRRRRSAGGWHASRPCPAGARRSPRVPRHLPRPAAGLAIGWLWQSNISFHRRYDPAGPPEAITLPDLSYFLLGSFSTVAEARAYLDPARLQITTQVGGRLVGAAACKRAGGGRRGAPWGGGCRRAGGAGRRVWGQRVQATGSAARVQRWSRRPAPERL